MNETRHCSLRSCDEPAVVKTQLDDGRVLVLCTKHGLELWDAVEVER